MNKLVIGDLHLNATWDGLDRTQDIFDVLYKQILPTIIGQDIKEVIWLGDIFHTNPSHTVISDFIDFLKRIDFVKHVILKGNHDGEPSSSKGSALEIIESTGLARIVWEPEIKDNDVYLPYCSQKVADEFTFQLPESWNFSFTHVDIPGAVPGSEVQVSRGAPCLLPEKIIKGSKQIIAGHLHSPQILGNINILGSITRTSMTEQNDTKRVMILYPSTQAFIFINDREMEAVAITVHAKTDIEYIKNYANNISFPNKIVSMKIICPSNLAHELDFNEIQDTIRKKCYYLKFESLIHKEKQLRMPSLEATKPLYEIIVDYVKNQGISDGDLILSDIKEYIL